ncbi:MAG: hypothetical protein JWN30_1964, partial [Bacilli bacterium]|nr:hypothetical protein [Bacilli bacterium]
MQPNTCMVWEQFFYYECEQLAARFLQETFEKKNTAKAKALAYQAAPKLSCAIRQAHEYYRAAETANLLIKPLLSFYGIACLVRALLVKDQPEYPSNSSVLKHGLSTRKLKRTGFQIINDVAVIQRAGLYVEFHNLLHGDQMSAAMRKYRVGDLLGIIPDVTNSFSGLGVPSSVVQLELEKSDHECVWSIPSSYFRNNSWALEEYVAYFNQLDPPDNAGRSSSDGNFMLVRKAPPGLVKLTRTGTHRAHPLLCSDLEGNWFLRVPPS